MKTLGFTIAGALGLKAWFRDANADQLTWLLKPTVVLGELLSRTITHNGLLHTPWCVLVDL